jgi:EC042_2821-lke REase
VERSVKRARREWLSGVRKVSLAPRGSTISVLPPQVVQSSDPGATPIRITADPNAPGYQLIDPDKTYPWRQKELLEELNKTLPTKINAYDLLAIRRFYRTDGDPKFFYKHRFGSQQYSSAFAKWILEQYGQNPRLFQKCRSALHGTITAQSTDDPVLLWLLEYMRKNSLSLSRMAQRLKIGAGTVSRLLAGKYKGDVKRMLDRIEEYRREEQAKAA